MKIACFTEIMGELGYDRQVVPMQVPQVTESSVVQNHTVSQDLID
jgi:hypothetical protein